MRIPGVALCTLLFLTIVSTRTTGQVFRNYDDVAVIVNDNDSVSLAIGEYFRVARGIRPDRVIHIAVPARETINTGEFDDLRAQIEAGITQRGIMDSLTMLVTTKGVPLRVDRGNAFTNSSVDSELMLILGPNASHIGTNSTVIINPNGTGSVISHPYFGRNEPFRRSAFGMYLVTRLVGLTIEDVYALIDRSGPGTAVDRDSALFVLDQDPRPIDAAYNQFMVTAEQALTPRGWRTLLNRDSVYVTAQRNVIGYVSWGSNDHYDHHYTEYARPKNHWLPGSVAETYVSTSARNFIPGQTAGQSRIADLIAEGCTGVSGYVFEPYSFALTMPHILFDRYTAGYTLAESFYMGNRTMSWMAVVVGDPKSTIRTTSDGVTVFPAALAFSPTRLGDARTLQVSLFNQRPSPLRVVSVSISGADAAAFTAQMPAIPLELDAGGRLVFDIRFAPSDTGQHQAVLSIDTDPPSNLMPVPLTGRGLDPTVAADPVTPLPEPQLHPVRPNPVRTHADLQFTLSTASQVRLTVLDALGRTVVVLAEGRRQAGSHRVGWHAGALPSGIYFVRLEVPGAVRTQRISVLR